MTAARRFVLRLFAALFIYAVFTPTARVQALSREEMRALWESACAPYAGALFAQEPNATAPYAAGQVSDGLLDAALGRLNFMRKLAGLGRVSLDEDLCAVSQHGAVLMAALGRVTHAPDQPSDMEASFFALAREAAESCNLATLNCSSESLLPDCVTLFMQDDAQSNLAVLGHRRWLLYPGMARTGFGLALDGEGRSYVSLYVMDDSAECDYDLICWPCGGAFPAELMNAQTPWSISPNPALYDLENSEPCIVLEETVSGAKWDFSLAGSDYGDGAYFLVSAGRCGDGPAYIFRPDLSDFPALENGYEQNQIWRVTLSGMVSKDQKALEPVSYVVEMASLTPIDPASVELSAREITLAVGETVSPGATVYPRWADDLSYTLAVSDPSVAALSAQGVLTALRAGQCTLTAETINGRTDEITVTVVSAR